jgi:nucleoside-diphosphate-sugar epimerase
MRILLIGGTGFVGPYVARELDGLGHDVTVFHRGEHESALLPSVRHLRSPQAAMPVLRFPPDLLRAGFEIVIHMIAMGEADAHACVQSFTGRARRLVVLSSGDVYRAYGRFTGLEPGPVHEGLLTENSPLRGTLYPYRALAKSPDELNYFYEKILVEREALGQADLPATVLRLPKVYGPGGNAELATIYGYRNHPTWRWTHGYVENVAAAIVLAALHPAAANRIFNVGEVYTPTTGERLKSLPPSTLPAVETKGHDFRHNLAYDTTRIRNELGYSEPVSYEEGLRRTFSGHTRADFL